eukprot:TRINITY_DN25389_c0_g1_i1.p1 TRINITY_DN25389_c0_g1~~TRINITY_DN25389_c0_g1_i1.p1  ORF type:complete len:355 (+),score=125.33 TRINITY_DN25389_c0_g1_i1:152-1216(+)
MSQVKNRFAKASPASSRVAGSGYLDDEPEENAAARPLLSDPAADPSTAAAAPSPSSSAPGGRGSPTQSEGYYSGIATKASRFFADLLVAITGVLPFLDYRDVTPEQLSRLTPFRDHVQEKFDPEKPEHLKRLLHLWSQYNDSLSTNEALVDASSSEGGDPEKSAKTEAEAKYVSKKWGKVGFQGSDPATDFRGGGVFSLSNLIYFSDAEPEVFERLLREAAASEGLALGSGRYALPVAIAGINVTMMLLHMLQLTAARTCFSTTQQKTAATRAARRNLTSFLLDAAAASENEQQLVHSLEAAFGRIYCYTFKLLDRLWQESSGNIMEFNSILLKCKTVLEDKLRVAQSLDDLCD